ncbi:MAG: response regulator transcription factor [Bacteroidales bacterium]|nr:response regulator transcription factor [Bacteroidales bacterium]MDD3035112.1 response regulator transcription factor [Bacteroidales bacterium]
MGKRILLADDELNFGYAMCEFLKMSGYELSFVSDGRSALEQYNQFHPDLCLFDVNMPEIDGFEVARLIRAVDKNIPIIFITSISDDSSVANGFEIGCSDYLKKPFGLRELLIRVQKCMQISSKNNDIFTLGNINYSPEERCLMMQDGEATILSFYENKLLQILCNNFNQICKVSDLVVAIWEDKDIDTKKSLEALASHLRKKLASTPVNIENIRGVGYRLRKM